MDQKNPRNFPAGDLRVSDADRDLALAELSEHFQAGRLTADEMQERTDQALRARTGQELSALMADLPVVQPGATVAPVSKEPVRRGLHWTPITTAALVVIVVLSVGAGAALSHPGHHSFPIWIIPVAFLVLRWFGHGGHHHDHHQQHRDREQERLDRQRRDLD